MKYLRTLFIYLMISSMCLFYYLFGGNSNTVLVLYFTLNSIFVVYVLFHYLNTHRPSSDTMGNIESAIFESARVSIISTDTNGIITHFSKGAEELLGYRREEFVGKESPAVIHDINEIVARNEELNEIFNEQEPPGFRTFVRKVYETDKDEREWTYIHKNGTRFPVILSVTAIKNFDSEIIGFLGIATDISKIKEKERQLEIANAKIKESDRVKSIFLSNMSHEIRTPLNSILGMSVLMQETNMNETQDSYLKFIKDSAHQLKNLLGDILDFSNLQSLNITISKKEIELDNFNHNLKNLLTLLAKDKNLVVDFIEYNLPKRVKVDALRLRQILTILITNSVRYTGFGSVKVYTEFLNETLTYVVEDTGQDISAKDIDLISNPYSHLATNDDLIGNVIIGLSIVRNIVELMDGKLEIERTPGLGTKFIITIPTIGLNSEINEKAKILKNSLHDTNILIVEDNLIGQKIIAKFLEMAGCEYVLVADGQKAVDAVKENYFDLVLMDYHLPILDGLEATLEIRKFNEFIPIVALTANAMDEDKNQCLLAGMNDFLTKPIEFKTLVETIEKNLKR